MRVGLITFFLLIFFQAKTQQKIYFQFAFNANPITLNKAIQIGGVVAENLKVELFDMAGKKVKSTLINKGQTIAYFDVQTLYAGQYFLKFVGSKDVIVKNIVITI